MTDKHEVLLPVMLDYAMTLAEIREKFPDVAIVNMPSEPVPPPVELCDPRWFKPAAVPPDYLRNRKERRAWRAKHR